MVTNRLYRSRTDRLIAGICGGLGQYFGVDPTLIRLFFVVATLLTGGIFLLVYLVTWIVAPEEPFGLAENKATEMGFTGSSDPGAADPSAPSDAPHSAFVGASHVGDLPSYEQIHRRRQWAGWALIVLGVVVLLANLNLLSWLNLRVTWPIFLILAGVLILLRQRNRLLY